MDRAQKPWFLRVVVPVALLALVGSTCAARAMAEERGAHAREHWRGGEVEHWGHGDIRRFHEGDLERWRGGSWFHGEHFGRSGWWWIVDGAWYFYPAAVYPYPDPDVPPTGRHSGASAALAAVLVLLPEREGVLPIRPDVFRRLAAGGPPTGAAGLERGEGSSCEAAPATARANVQRVRLACGHRAPPRSWTLLLALAAFVRWAPSRRLAEEPAIYLGGERKVHSVTNIPAVPAA